MRLLVAISHFIDSKARPLCREDSDLSQMAGFLLRRTQGNIVPYNRALMMAVPGNHMISLLPELARYVRERYIWKMAVASGKEVGEISRRSEHSSCLQRRAIVGGWLV